ncbi:hypothetical protein [Methylobacter psychrophilus]|uniref:hypothetical protein n=1 Tax=Methylobacter psychrophilus TaxID=96941 RepID=UPI0021D4F7E4|nr:hypothetical protein [Methylobacter psychrophilus]
MDTNNDDKQNGSFDFNTQLEMSQGVVECSAIESILLSQISGALNVHAIHEVNDRNGVDY